MIKRIIYLLVPLAVVASCDKTKQPVPDDKTETKTTLTVSPSALSFAADGESHYVNVSSSGDWTADWDDNWITVSPASGTGNISVTVKADKNSMGERSGTVTFRDKGKTATATFTVKQAGYEKPVETAIVPNPDPLGQTKLSSTTYQLLIYSFADSDGDGIGDFKGIQNHLDYLDAIGATALWLSPAHPADSYHGYNVTDYKALNQEYGTETDFENLIDAAHKRGIKIYMDYVLNHSGKGHPWFIQALMGKSPYQDWYFISSNPSADFQEFPMLNGTDFKDGEWKPAVSGSPRLTITKTDEAEISGNANWNLWYWDGNGDKELRFVDNGDGSFYLVKQINDVCGMLLRRYRNWNNDSKFGAVPGSGTLVEGQPMDLVWQGADITFSGKGRYRIELSNVSVSNVRYLAGFDAGMPDLNYGDLSDVANNACFRELAASADKWIMMGVDGFRLDAVKHICGGYDSFNNEANQTFLKEWYNHCNATYKNNAGHTDDIFMVGEAAGGHALEKLYYEGLPSNFEFDYFNVLKNAVNGNTEWYVTSVNNFLSEHSRLRTDAITSLFMTNHDQNRAAEAFDKSEAKEKQAAAMLLTTPGKVFIYQGEELGYYGYGDHEYIRTPILWEWDKNLTHCAKAWAGGKIDTGMLTDERSVKTQESKDNSLLNVYRTWSRLRNTYAAFTDGTMTAGPAKSHFATWYLTGTDGSKFLVIHYTGSNEKGDTIDLSDDTSHPVALLGTGTLADKAGSTKKTLRLGPSSSVVFKL